MKSIRVISLLIVLFILSGCIGSQPQGKLDQEKIQSLNDSYSRGMTLSAKNPLKYAYINKEGILLEIRDDNNQSEESQNEIIVISEDGFYPNYTMKPGVESGEEFKHCPINSSRNNPNKIRYCNSQFTGVTISDVATTVVAESIAAVFSLGLTLATGAAGSNPYFDKELFFKVVKNNHLDEVREKLVKGKKPKIYVDAEKNVNIVPINGSDILKIYDHYKENMKQKWDETTASYNSRVAKYKDNVKSRYSVKMHFAHGYNADLEKSLALFNGNILAKKHIGSAYASNGYELKNYRTLYVNYPLIQIYPSQNTLATEKHYPWILMNGSYTPGESETLLDNISIICIVTINFDGWLAYEKNEDIKKYRNHIYSANLEMLIAFDRHKNNKIYAIAQ